MIENRKSFNIICFSYDACDHGIKEVNLPDGWKWEEPNLDITENMTKAIIVRIDESNYIQSRFEIELAFVTDSERPAGSYILWWSLGIIGGIIGVVVATVVIWLVGRKKRRQN